MGRVMDSPCTQQARCVLLPPMLSRELEEEERSGRRVVWAVAKANSAMAAAAKYLTIVIYKIVLHTLEPVHTLELLTMQARQNHISKAL